MSARYKAPRPCLGALFTFLILTVCVSCGARLDGEIHSDSRAEFTLKSALLPNMERLLTSLSEKGGGPVFDAALLNRSFAAIQGVEASSLRNTGQSGLEGGIVVSSMTRFLSGAEDTLVSKTGVKKFSAIVWEHSASGGSLTIDLNINNGQELLLLVSPDLVDYLSALMAPIVTGEVIGRDAYLELVASVYGKAIADEIRGANFLLNLDFPGPVESVTGGTGKGSHAKFTIPLTDLLVLNTPLRYEVRWTPWRS